MAFNKQYKESKRQVIDAMTSMRATCSSIAEIEQFVMNNWEVFWLNGATRWQELTGEDFSSFTPMTITRFSLLGSTRYTPAKSYQNGECAEKNSVQGVMEFSWSALTPITFTAFFHNTGINMTSGGGTDTNFRTGFVLWEDEWPALQMALDMERVANKLARV